MSQRGRNSVRQDTETKLYRFGPRVFGLARALYQSDALVVAPCESLTDAHEKAGETIVIIVLDGDETVCIDARESTHPLHVGVAIGSRAILGSR